MISQIHPVVAFAVRTIIAISRNDGTTSSISSSHMPTRSTQPPKKEMAVPSSEAIAIVATEVMMPIISDLPRPRTTMAYRSEPPESVPSQWLALGPADRARKSGSSYAHLPMLAPNSAKNTSTRRMISPTTAER